MFERFTDLSRRVVVLAQEEARLLNHNYIGTEHLLLGLLHTEQGTAYDALTEHGVTLMAVRSAIPQFSPQGTEAPRGHIPFTIRSKRSLEYALREALRMGSNDIDTEHLLLGVLRRAKDDGEPPVAARVLVSLGVDLVALEGTLLWMKRQPRIQPHYITLDDELQKVRKEKGEDSPDFKLALARLLEKNARRLRKEAKDAAFMAEGLSIAREHGFAVPEERSG